MSMFVGNMRDQIPIKFVAKIFEHSLASTCHDKDSLRFHSFKFRYDAFYGTDLISWFYPIEILT